MKIRNGFVSNSSSSSFVVTKKGITKEEFVKSIEDVWNYLYENPSELKYPIPKELKCNIRKVSRFIDVQEIGKLKAKDWICTEYSNEYWDAKSHISDRKGSQTYLQQAMKAVVFGIADENSIPYQVLEELEEIYGNNLIIHHLG